MTEQEFIESLKKEFYKSPYFQEELSYSVILNNIKTLVRWQKVAEDTIASNQMYHRINARLKSELHEDAGRGAGLAAENTLLKKKLKAIKELLNE